MKNIMEVMHAIKKSKPLILNLSNFVTMDFVANGLLAVGATPIMSIYEDEMEELVKIACAIYINIGTLDDRFIQLIQKATTLSQRYNKPIVMDPVGCGATKIRTKIARELAPYCEIIRGNASEIMALANQSFLTRGVDSVHNTEDVIGAADQIAKEMSSVIIISGAVDYITDGMDAQQSGFGSPIMTRITGMGCCLSAIIAATLAITNRPFNAGVVGVEYFSLCGELAAKKHQKLGSFKSAFMDMLYRPDFNAMSQLYDI